MDTKYKTRFDTKTKQILSKNSTLVFYRDSFVGLSVFQSVGLSVRLQNETNKRHVVLAPWGRRLSYDLLSFLFLLRLESSVLEASRALLKNFTKQKKF